MSQNNKWRVYFAILLILLHCYLFSKCSKITVGIQQNILEFKFYFIFGGAGGDFV